MPGVLVQEPGMRIDTSQRVHVTGNLHSLKQILNVSNIDASAIGGTEMRTRKVVWTRHANLRGRRQNVEVSTLSV